MSRSHKAKSYFPLTGIFLAPTLFIERASAVQNAENADLESLLYQAREEAVGLDRDADEMEMLVRSDLDWQTHAVYLDRCRRSNTRPLFRQQQTIDQVVPLQHHLATNTRNAMNHLNQNRVRLSDLAPRKCRGLPYEFAGQEQAPEARVTAR